MDSKRKHFTTKRNTAASAEKVEYKPRTYSGNGPDRDFRTDRSYDSSERPRTYGDRPRSYGDRPRTFGDKPARTYGDKPARTYGDKPRTYGSKPKTFGDKPRYGSRKPARDNAREGIEKMIQRNPRVDSRVQSDNDTVKAPVQEVIRLNKFIANSGVCSRREADVLIQSGVVTVNGEVITELGTKINVLTDEVRCDGQRLKGEEKVYIVMNKPKGFVTTASDPHTPSEQTVMSLLKGCSGRVFPVGRLDKNTTGVLMFTNDGEMAERLTHPSYNKKKIYQVTLDHPLTEDDKNRILQGVELNDGLVNADELEYIDQKDHRKLGIEIHSGKNRIVRRIFESLGYDVKALDRVYFAGLTKKGLKKSDWRYLTEGEINILKMGAYI